MNELDKYYNNGISGALVPTMETLEQRLTNELKQAKSNVTRIERLMSLLERNPEVQEIINLLGNRY